MQQVPRVVADAGAIADPTADPRSDTELGRSLLAH